MLEFGKTSSPLAFLVMVRIFSYLGRFLRFLFKTESVFH